MIGLRSSLVPADRVDAAPVTLSAVAQAPGAARAVDLVVVLNGFPRMSETFVLHELLDLEARGLRLHVVALRQPEEAVAQEATARLRASVEYLSDLPAGATRNALRLARAALFLRGRRRFLDGLVRVSTSPDYSRGAMARATLLAHRIAQLGAPPVYVHFAHKPATVGRFAALLAGVPYAISAHAKDIWLTPEEELGLKIRDAEVVLTCTEEGRSHLEKLARGHTPVRLARHGVETDVPLVRPRGDASEPVVLSVGRLMEKKGHDILLRAAAHLLERGARFTVRIAGDGPEWPKLQRLVHTLGLADRVTFLGPLTENELRDEWARADIFALACRRLPDGDRDGTPNVVLEAMARGLPIVSTRLAGVVEAVSDGQSGLLAAQDDPEQFAECLARLLDDRKLRAEFGKNARERVLAHFGRSASLPAVWQALASAGLVSWSTLRDPRTATAEAA